MRGEQVRCPGHRRLTVLLVALMFSVGASGCMSSLLAPVGPLVAATEAQFSRPVSAAVTAGSTGMESSGPNDAHWWLTSASADVTVSNNSQRSPVIEVTATIMPSPCAGVVEVVVDSMGSPSIRLVAGSAGKLLSLRLDVPLGQSRTIHLSVLTPVCYIATDPRSFYAGLFVLRAQTPQVVELRYVKGLSDNQVVAPAPSLNWLTESEAEIAVTHNSGPSAKLKVTGFAIPPPCPGSTAQITVKLPGSPSVRLDTGTSATAITIAFVAPIGSTRTVRFIVSSAPCRIASDNRTFFAGLTRLRVSAG
jgi:hypothetical protein